MFDAIVHFLVHGVHQVPDQLAIAPLVLGALIGGGLGVGKHLMAQGAANRDRKLQAETARYSPWTGLVAKQTQDPNLFGNLLEGGATGAMLGQGLGSMQEAATPVAESAGFAPSAEVAAQNQAAGMGGFPGFQGGIPYSAWRRMTPWG